MSQTSWGTPWSLQPEDGEGEGHTEGGEKEKVFECYKALLTIVWLLWPQLRWVLKSYTQLHNIDFELLTVIAFLCFI